jgi:hypothetical protein
MTKSFGGKQKQSKQDKEQFSVSLACAATSVCLSTKKIHKLFLKNGIQ